MSYLEYNYSEIFKRFFSNIVDLINQNRFTDMPNLLQEAIACGHRVSVCPIHEYWIDIGQFEDFQKANSDYEKVFLKGKKESREPI